MMMMKRRTNDMNMPLRPMMPLRPPQFRRNVNNVPNANNFRLDEIQSRLLRRLPLGARVQFDSIRGMPLGRKKPFNIEKKSQAQDNTNDAGV